MGWRRRTLGGAVAAAFAVAIASAQDVSAQAGTTSDVSPGPLERSARPVTPENPIPRRLSSVLPVYPAAARRRGATVGLIVRTTLDAIGRVAEARALRDTAARGNFDAFEAAALDAVRQWSFEPPADPPLTFDVRLTFVSESQVIVRFDQMYGLEEPRQVPAWYAATAQIRPRRTDRNRAPYSVGAVLAPGETSMVILDAEIGTNGRVQNPRLVFGNPRFLNAALQAVGSWRFDSARADGKKVPYTMRLTVRFER